MPKKTAGEQPEKKKKRRRTSVTVGHKMVEVDGEQIRVPIKKYPSASSGKKLDQKVDALKLAFGAGGPGEMADVLFCDYAEKWLEVVAGQVSDNSLDTYRCHVRGFLIPHLGNKQVRSIMQSDIKSMMARLSKTETQRNDAMAANTLRAVLNCLKQIMGMATDDRIRLDNPAQRVSTKSDLEPKRRALTDAEKAACLQFIADHPGTEEAVALAMLYYTSCRRGEAFGPQWKHVDFKNRKIKICQQLTYKKGGGGQISPKLKTKNSYRDIPMPQQLYDVLHSMRGTSDAFVFQRYGKHFGPHDVQSLWDGIVEQCPALSQISPHYFRHNYATMLYKNKIQAKEAAAVMGETVRVMMDTYVHIEKEIGEETSAAICNIFSEVAK